MIQKNIISNIVARVWGIISVYLFVPLYLKFLGMEAFGLVGFYSTLLGVLAFADMGFTATLNREMARLSVRSNSAEEMRDLLRTYEVAYALISSLLSLLIWFLAPLIAEHWLSSRVLQPAEMTTAIRLMGVGIAFQMPSGLYIGGLMGLQRQVRANSLQILWGVFRGVGAVLVLWLFSSTIFAFALWQLVSNAIYCFVVRLSLWRALSPNPAQSKPHFKLEVFRSTWRYAAGMAGMSFIGLLLMQTDKLVVSKMLSLEMLGYYTLAGTLASVPIMLVSTISSAVFPRFTELVALEDRNGLAQLYRKTCELVGVAIIPAGLTLLFFAGDFILAWTGSTITAQRAGLVASLLLGGQLLQAMTVVPYYLELAQGNVRYGLQIGITSIVLITPLLFYLIMKLGVVGAGGSWLIMNTCTMPINMYFLHRRILVRGLRRYCLRGIGLSLLVTLPCVLLGRLLLPHTSSRPLLCSQLALVWGVAVTVSAMIIPGLRFTIIENARRISGLLDLSVKA
jgi:O-antigen/teichoic acid export membrane protein